LKSPHRLFFIVRQDVDDGIVKLLPPRKRQVELNGRRFSGEEVSRRAGNFVAAAIASDAADCHRLLASVCDLGGTEDSIVVPHLPEVYVAGIMSISTSEASAQIASWTNKTMPTTAQILERCPSMFLT
jgi:hypothetical protein